MDSTVQVNWISELLRRRGYETPTKEPLFTYQLTEEEYQSLKAKLRRTSSSASFKNQIWCAEFCLFSSEWYRRQYMSGWSWTGIFEELSFDIEANYRSEIVIKGMTFWGRPINRYDSDRNDYLGTVCREGGLPFGLLASEGSRFQSLFKKLLSDFDRAKAFGQSPIPAIQAQLEKMPDAFQAESTVMLLNDMVANLYGLIDTYSLDKQSEPAPYLDSMAPKWRATFPIPLDGATGNEFLSGLLKSATHQRKETKKRQERLTINQWLSNAELLAFSAEIKLSSQFSVPLTKNDLSAPMVEIYILEGNQQIADFGLARAEFSDGGVILNMRKALVQFRRENLSVPLKLVVMQAGRVRHSEELPLSNLPLDEMPLVLDNSGDKKFVIGSGSVSKKANTLIALVAEEISIHGDGYKIIDDEHRDFYRVITFSGDLQVEYETAGSIDIYSLSTKADSFSKELIDIKGKTLEFDTDTGYPVYLGVPKIDCHYPETKIYLGDNELGKTDNIAELYGRQILRVKSNGKTLYRRKIAILPESFELHLIPGKASNQGAIKLSCSQTFIYDVLNEIKTRTSSLDGEKRIELNAEGAPPLHITLQVQANLLAEPINLRVPFPARGALLFDGEGKELRRALCVEELLGARALLFKVANRSRTDFDIELKAPTSAIGNASYTFRYKVEKPVEEVNLYEYRHKIKELLATAGNGQLDEVVRLIISSPSTTSKQYTIGWNSMNVSRESNLLVFDEHEVEDFAEVKVELLNLADPEEHAERLSQRTSNGIPVGRFELPLQTKTPKLAVPTKDSKVKFRAVFIPPTEHVESDSKAKSLGKAAMLYHPVHNKDAFNVVLDDMALNIEHSGWRYLDTLFSKYEHLPMLTFEAWKALSKHPSSLTLLPFATKQKTENIMQVLQTEFNTVWQFTTMKSWSRTINIYEKYVTSKGLPAPIVDNFVKSKAEEISNFMGVPIFSIVDGKWGDYFVRVQKCLDELKRNNSEFLDEWPSYFSKEISSWVSEKAVFLKLFDVPHLKQTSVMYFPIVAAAVVAGKATWSEVLHNTSINYFQLRQLMDFDRDWFNAFFQGALYVYLTE